jgi:hypothetical protein
MACSLEYRSEAGESFIKEIVIPNSEASVTDG